MKSLMKKFYLIFLIYFKESLPVCFYAMLYDWFDIWKKREQTSDSIHFNKNMSKIW